MLLFKSQGGQLGRTNPIVSVKIQNKLFGPPGFNKSCFLYYKEPLTSILYSTMTSYTVCQSIKENLISQFVIPINCNCQFSLMLLKWELIPSALSLSTAAVLEAGSLFMHTFQIPLTPHQ